MEDLVLSTRPMSRGRMVRWMLEEVRRPYRTEVLDFAATTKAPAYLGINPLGKAPATTSFGRAAAAPSDPAPAAPLSASSSSSSSSR